MWVFRSGYDRATLTFDVLPHVLPGMQRIQLLSIASLLPCLLYAGYVCDATRSFDGSTTYDGLCDGSYEGVGLEPGNGLTNILISGTLPTELTLLPNIEYIVLARQQISGTIPTEFGLLTNLHQLLLHNDLLSGTIPTEFGQLTRMTDLVVYGNQISGSVPNGVYLNPNSHPILGANQIAPSPPPSSPAPPFPPPTLSPPPSPASPPQSSRAMDDSDESGCQTGCTIAIMVGAAVLALAVAVGAVLLARSHGQQLAKAAKEPAFEGDLRAPPMA